MYGKLARHDPVQQTLKPTEFQRIYSLEAVIIRRTATWCAAMNDLFLNDGGECAAAVHDIRDCYERGQPGVGRTPLRLKNSG